MSSHKATVKSVTTEDGVVRVVMDVEGIGEVTHVEKIREPLPEECTVYRAHVDDAGGVMIRSGVYARTLLNVVWLGHVRGDAVEGDHIMCDRKYPATAEEAIRAAITRSDKDIEWAMQDIATFEKHARILKEALENV